MEPPHTTDVNVELQWLGAVLGLFNERDKDSSCFRIFISLVRAAHMQQVLSSDTIAFHCGLSRGTVVHHLRKLQDAGLVMGDKAGYRLVKKSMHDSIDQLEQNLHAMIKLMRAVAKNIDAKL